jgi:programmed cell death protein 5
MNGEMIDAEKLQQLKQIEEMKKQLMTNILTKDAFERLGRVRTVNPDLAGQLELYLIQVYQAGQIKERITDEQLKSILKALQQKRDFRIKRA